VTEEFARWLRGHHRWTNLQASTYPESITTTLLKRTVKDFEVGTCSATGERPRTPTWECRRHRIVLRLTTDASIRACFVAAEEAVESGRPSPWMWLCEPSLATCRVVSAAFAWSHRRCSYRRKSSLEFQNLLLDENNAKEIAIKTIICTFKGDDLIPHTWAPLRRLKLQHDTMHGNGSACAVLA
jgi:hypothetical protein